MSRGGDQVARGRRHEIRLLGPFTVLRDGEPVPEQEIGSRKARTLLKRLLVERDRVVAVDGLAEVLWPGNVPDHADRQIATLVSRLRAKLGSDVVVRAGDGYRYRTAGQLIDVDEAERLTAEAEARLAAGEPGLAHAAARRALELLDRGEILADEPYAEWALPARHAAAVLLRRARRCAWAAALAVRDLDSVLTVAQAALTVEPFDEPACRALMRAHRARGEPGLALAAYERLRAALADDLGVDPAEETRDLHRAILRDEPEQAADGGDGAAAAGGRAVVTGAVTGRVSVAGPGPGDFVGRQRELATLREAWSRATDGQARLVLLLGEAGVGKTTLAGEVVRLVEATGGTVVRARCYEAERSLFLQPVADALRPIVTSSSPDVVRAAVGHLAGSLTDLIAELADIVPASDPVRASPEVERRRVFEAVTGFVRALTDRRPVLLYLDDVHLAGMSTLELLHILLRRLAGRPALILATARIEEATEVVQVLGELGQRCDLGPLDETAVRELARRSGLERLVGPIMERTGGHSLYVVETLRALATQPPGAGGLVVPESLRSAVVTRMRRAGSDVEELLRAAAVIGGIIDPAVLAGLIGEPVARTALRAQAAVRARLLVEAAETYEFANELIREIAYQSTPLPVRFAWHRRAAELLAGNPEAVAGHASRAGDWAAAMEAYLRAAEAAAGRFANREAVRLLESAMAAAVRAGDQVGMARVRLARGRIREALTDYQGAYEDHRAVVETARANARTDLELVALNHLGGDILVGLGRPTRECIPYLDSALRLAEAVGDVSQQIDILGRLSVIWSNRLRFDLAGDYAERATSLAGSSAGGSERALATDAVKTRLAHRGEVAGLRALLPRLEADLDRYEQHRYRYRRVQLAAWMALESAFPALATGRWAEAVNAMERALAITHESGYVAYDPPFRAHLAWVERARGRYGAALAHGRRAAALADRTGHPWWVALTRTMHGWTLTELGRADEAVRWLEPGLAAAERDATEAYLLRCLGHLSWAYALRGDHDRAARLAGRAEAVLGQVTGGVFLYGAHAVLAAAAARLTLSEPEAAARLADLVHTAASEQGWVEVRAWADLLRARCRRATGDLAGAVELAGSALAATEQAELPGLAWQAHALLAATGEYPEGCCAAAAAATTDRLAASLADDQQRADFRAAVAEWLGPTP